MARLLKSPAAEADLLEIWAYIAEDSADTADRFLDRFEEAMLLLADTPAAGRPRAELGSDIRSLPVGRYVIFYRPIPSSRGIEVVRVIHGSRDLQTAWEE